jgi:plastocyanin
MRAGTATARRRRGFGWRRMVALAGAVVLVAAACGDDGGSTASTGTTVAPGTTAGADTTTTAPVSDDIVVHAGVNDPDDPTIAVLQYLPAKVTVEVGAEVTWSWDGTIEPHSVTFLEPGQELPAPGSDPTLFAPTPATGPIDGSAFVNSGLLPLGPGAVDPLTLAFDTEGTYSYFCVIHPQMVGEVEVVASGGDTPADIAERAAQEQDEWLAEGQAAKKAFESAGLPATTNKDGTKTYQIEMGTSTAHTDILAFSPTPVGIKAGDQVKFVNNSAAPHTGSFFGTGAEVITNPTDPRVDAPAPGPSPQTLLAAGFFNTGLLPPNAPPGAGPPEAVRSFVFTVPKAGAYSYVCILHAASGMVGTVNAS